MRLVVDANVVVKWFASKELRPEAHWLESLADRLIAFDLLLIEPAVAPNGGVRWDSLDAACKMLSPLRLQIACSWR